VRAALKQLWQIEPELAVHLCVRIVMLGGDLEAGWRERAIRYSIYDESTRASLSTAFSAQRAAFSRLWQEGFPGTPLASLIKP